MIAEVLTNSDAISIYLIFPIPSYAHVMRGQEGREIRESTKIGTRVRNVSINCMQLVVMVYQSYTCSAFDIDGMSGMLHWM